MSKTLTHGPSGTAVEGLAAVTYTIPPLNYDADFRAIEEGVGKVVYTDVSSPQDQPSTLRIAQQSKANVYAGTTIDPSVFLANRRGSDTIIEVREVWAETESTDASYLRLMPVRAAITLSLPTAATITYSDVSTLIGRAIAGLFAQADATNEDGITGLLHGVVKRD